MTRSALTLAGFFAAGCLAVVGYSFLTRVEPESGKVPQPLVSSSQAMNAETVSAPPVDEVAPAPPSEPAEATSQHAAPAPEATGSVAKWLADATGENAQARAKAISALAYAPKDSALPVLKKVLTGGEPEVDRPLALASLRTIALEQGDDDGRIKDTLRQTVSHADSETLAAAAQSVLDEVP